MGKAPVYTGPVTVLVRKIKAGRRSVDIRSGYRLLASRHGAALSSIRSSYCPGFLGTGYGAASVYIWSTVTVLASGTGMGQGFCLHLLVQLLSWHQAQSMGMSPLTFGPVTVLASGTGAWAAPCGTSGPAIALVWQSEWLGGVLSTFVQGATVLASVRARLPVCHSAQLPPRASCKVPCYAAALPISSSYRPASNRAVLAS
ncbi:hypothetical protein AVEN_182117-1 [Araneus ventricosus]|uniref:Uncharacterized protein n=1 Tax=Araneus ventricosus TaxID=182803 RepID=A0A4Y2UHW7_ARAVE|nr:hypothetical protein AVEN_182117-1 [Araneus ventricosus]